jgi:hypothetical protein
MKTDGQTDSSPRIVQNYKLSSHSDREGEFCLGSLNVVLSCSHRNLDSLNDARQQEKVGSANGDVTGRGPTDDVSRHAAVSHTKIQLGVILPLGGGNYFASCHMVHDSVRNEGMCVLCVK